MHGVNTGGWLVTEYWINSNDKVFEGVDPQVVNLILLRFILHTNERVCQLDFQNRRITSYIVLTQFEHFPQNIFKRNY